MENRRSLFGALLPILLICIGSYFAFAAVQGDYGLFHRVQVEAQAERLETQLAEARADVQRMENLTLRLSDGFLDLDLLDQQAREILGYAHPDELRLPY